MPYSRPALGALALLAALPIAAPAQDVDSTRAFTTVSLSTELTDATAFRETGFLLGRLHRLGEDGRWSVRGELGLGLVDALDGYSGYAGVMASAGRSWEQRLFHLSERVEVRPALSVGGGLYRFGYAGDLAGLASWTPLALVGVGVHGVAAPRAGASHGRMVLFEVVREERLGEGWGGRWFVRAGMALGTPAGAFIPERRPSAWWDRDAPEIPRGPATGMALPRADLPHHVYGYRAEERRPGRLQDPAAGAPVLPGSVWEGTHTEAEAPSRLGATEEALERHPDDAFAMHEHGVALAVRGRMAGALRAFVHALAATSSAPQRAIILTDIGTAWAALGWPDSAVVAWEAATAEQPRLLAPRLNTGVLFEELGHGEAALLHYRRAAAAIPEVAGAWENLAYALVRVGRAGEAVEPLRRALLLRADARGEAAIRWRCADLELYADITAEAWLEGERCTGRGAVPSPRLLPDATPPRRRRA